MGIAHGKQHLGSKRTSNELGSIFNIVRVVVNAPRKHSQSIPKRTPAQQPTSHARPTQASFSIQKN